ncbi:MAG: asparagine synthase [Microbacterium sp. SCN 70-200]|uniref:asparagine synthase n=1 Tax=unclassified Microbacterium TaxID=2609290 RepID=UPI00086E76DC|nr:MULTISPECIES: asparagine synthase [unclassified Microbacterium]MBN9215544.1 asparagine synthase [Microbacterium sp.]ODT41172.1 MAG: asparagine synthase [Microbacterium sp. SCN 70-200]OJV79432.1 MAG: asparagine synthase [Microbacterium sp. 70-16]
MVGKKRVRTRDVVAEGLYIASAATRLSLKNTILVHILAEGEDFNPDRYVPEAREALEALAVEAEEDAARTERERKRARTRHSDSDGTHDYRARDVRNLRHREKQSLHVASELRRRAEDDEELRKLISDARDAAWAEVAKNIDRTLRIEASRPDLEPDYERMRTARMQALRLVDLPKLRAHRRTARAQQKLIAAGEIPEIVTDGALPAGGVDPAELE